MSLRYIALARLAANSRCLGVVLSVTAGQARVNSCRPPFVWHATTYPLVLLMAKLEHVHVAESKL